MQLPMECVPLHGSYAGKSLLSPAPLKKAPNPNISVAAVRINNICLLVHLFI